MIMFPSNCCTKGYVRRIPSQTVRPLPHAISARLCWCLGWQSITALASDTEAADAVADVVADAFAYNHSSLLLPLHQLA
jgi:hypothetical protein